MGWVFETANSFEPLKVERHQVTCGTTIRSWVELQYPERKEFSVPTICLFNGRPLMRKDWDRPIGEGDIVNFVAIVADPITLIIITIVMVVVLVLVTVLMPVPTPPGSAPASDPVYSVKGQENAVRLGEPIEVCYGRNRIYPSLASRPFYLYSSNDQYQHSLMCVGQGSYDIEAIQIGDAGISSYQEVEYEIIPPGGTTTLFNTNVYTSPEAGGHFLLSSNEDGYPPDGWFGPYPACLVGETTNKIEIDIVFPKGLYKMDSGGALHPMTVTVECQYREIDDVGAPLGTFHDLVLPSPITITAKTTTAQRRTYGGGVPEARYEVRMRRTGLKKLSARVGNDVVWEGLRSFVITGATHSFGDVTLLAVKIKATNNLNSQTQSRFNVIATRKLPVLESGGWSEPQPTRSIVSALADIFRSEYGGRLEDTFLDLETLRAMDDFYNGREEYFDWCFRDASTVWTAAQQVARVGRALPLLSGSLVTMKRDGPLEVPVAMFNQENMVEGSFEWAIKLWDLDEHDSIRIEYTDPSTGYKQEQVTAVLPGGTYDHPEDIRMEGIQDRTHAYRTGMYMLAAKRYLRENVTFETGLEGYIPTYGDLIAVSHDVPQWGQAGYIVNAVRGTGTSYQLWLSEPLTFAEGVEHQILLRGRTADIIGPVTAYPTSDPQQVVIHSASDIDFLLDGTTEPMLFLFGVSNNITKYLRVMKVEPQGQELVRISAVNEAPVIHSFDSLVPAPLATTFFPPITPDLPTIDYLYISQMDSSQSIVQVTWTAALGAQYYLVQTSEDGDNWMERANTTRTSVQLQVFPGDFYVRVAGVNNGQGPWKQASAVIGLLSNVEVSTAWDALEWEVKWFPVLYAVSYEVIVYDNSESAPVLKHTVTQTALSFHYDLADATTDANVVREMIVTVDPVLNDDDTGTTAPSGHPVEVVLSNELPVPVEPVAAAFVSLDSAEVVYQLTWTPPDLNADVNKVLVWLSATPGFDPTVDVPIATYTGLDPVGSVLQGVPLDSYGGHPAYYFRIGLQDVWGSELAANISVEHTIPAYP